MEMDVGSDGWDQFSGSCLVGKEIRYSEDGTKVSETYYNFTASFVIPYFDMTLKPADELPFTNPSDWLYWDANHHWVDISLYVSASNRHALNGTFKHALLGFRQRRERLLCHRLLRCGWRRRF